MVLVRVARWWPVLSGVVLTVAGIVLRDGAVGVVLLPGLVLVLSAPLIPPSPKTERVRRALLEREMAAYSTPAQRRDFETTLNRYPDRVTCEFRDILARQAAAACHHSPPGSGHAAG
jgi:4-amino-4-deoxy-L-arabinose transferase-like glycosyltransferase